MENKYEFQKRIDAVLEEIGPEILSYNEDEFWMIQSPYEFIQYYASKNQLYNTLIALPLCRGIHNGSYRKSKLVRHDNTYKQPYVIHCLKVCEMIANLPIDVSMEEKDILMASALCHDMIEDIPFPEHGKELMTRFHLDPRVYETVLLVSKRRDFTKEQEREHFHQIEIHPRSLIVKLSDRGNNIEDLYNMSVWKVHEYIGETREYFLPMITYGRAHFPHLIPTLEIFRDKLCTLTEVAEILVDRFEAQEQSLIRELNSLQEENKALRQEWNSLWHHSSKEDQR